jgi:hypothetical protein
MLDPRDFRLRYFLLILFAAILIAALLRHTLHVYGGLSREYIGLYALVAAVGIGLIVALRRRFQRKSD